MDRSFIERKDFPAARKGWDPDAVREHLRSVADAAEEAARRSVPASAAEQAGDRVRMIVEAAENSADDIVKRAQKEADEVLAEAKRQAAGIRERAEAAAAKHVEEVEATGKRFQERAAATEADFESMLENLHPAGDGLLDRLRGGAGEIQGRLEAILGSLPALKDWDEDDEPDDDGFDPADDDAETDEEEAEDDEEEGEAPTEDPGARVAAERELDPLEAAAAGAEESARIVALNMALGGTPREETATYLAENFNLESTETILDDVYARVS
jgi:hypothetical protein